MRSVLFFSAMALAAAAWAVDWKALPSPAEYGATVDLDSVAQQQGLGRFTLRRAYASAQSHPSGKDYYSTRLVYLANCSSGAAALVLTQYYGEDRKLIQADIRPNLKRSEMTAPESGSDVGEALKLACERLAAKTQSGSASAQGSPPDAGSQKKAEAAPAAPKKPPVPGSSSGSGIVISGDGHILTNQHVVRECDSYQVIDNATRILKASLRAVDAARDLALLTVEERFPSVASVRKEAAPRLGEAVIVVGYPLVGVLGTRPTVGFGHISSTVGVRGNPAQMQISVPVQRGASGGPVFDQAGNVIGVVVSKLDALKVAERTGDLPQNVNFAIRGEVLRAFLESQNINFTASEDSARLENTDIASRGAAVTVRVRCIREAATAGSTATSPQ
jgi:S1-C subfamily serine protease